MKITRHLNSDNLELTPLDDKIIEPKNSVSLFLAGTIDMGESDDWQSEIDEKLKDLGTKFIIYNPRREEWPEGEPNALRYQINWELDHLESSDYIIMNILGDSKSPITLLELGLFAKSGKLWIACEPDFYRYENVQITAERYNVKLFDSLDLLIKSFKMKITRALNSAIN